MDENILSLIEKLYAASMDDALWLLVIQQLATLLQSKAAVFWALNCRHTPQITTLTSYNLSAEYVEQYQNQMMLQDPLIRYLTHYPDPDVVTDTLWSSPDAFEKEAYCQWHYQMSGMRHCLLIRYQVEAETQLGITLHRDADSGPYSNQQIAILQQLAQHINRAFILSYMRSKQALQAVWVNMLLEQSNQAAILVDQHLTVINLNAAARRVLAEKDGVDLLGEALILTRTEDNRKLQKMLGSVQPGAHPYKLIGAIQAKRTSGKPDYYIAVSLLDHMASLNSFNTPLICITIQSNELLFCKPDLNHKLEVLFELTPSEARLVSHLCQGDDLKAASLKLGLQYSTVRARLADVFRKTGVNSQSSLLLLVMSYLNCL